MPGPDFAVAAVTVEAGNRLRATTSVPADAVDASDPRDVLNPGAWILYATGNALPDPLPLVVDVEPWLAPSDVVPPLAPSVFLLYLDATLDPGGAYALGLAAFARSASGAPTDVTPFSFTGPATRGLAGQGPNVLAGDIADPPVADATGDLVVTDEQTAYHDAILRLVAARKGAYAHLPDAGRSVEPKRTYSLADVRQARSDLEAVIRAHPDTRAVRVSAGMPAPHLLRFDCVATSRFSARPVAFSDTVQAGANPSSGDVS